MGEELREMGKMELEGFDDEMRHENHGVMDETENE